MYEFNATAPPASQPGAEIDPAPILAIRQKWLLMESELGRTSSSKGQISLVATTSIREFIPCSLLYLSHVRVMLASVPKSTDLIQLSLPVIFEKSSHSFGLGPWIALSEHPNSGVYRSCPDMTPRSPLAISRRPGTGPRPPERQEPHCVFAFHLGGLHKVRDICKWHYCAPIDRQCRLEGLLCCFVKTARPAATCNRSSPGTQPGTQLEAWQ